VIPTRFGYFVLQAQTSAEDGPPHVRVVLEDLGTGEKQAFDSPIELGQYLDRWGSLGEGHDKANDVAR
jgi:hypothetical protein